MSGTYEHRGGTPAHDPSFDRCDDIYPLEEEVLVAIEDAQAEQQRYAAAVDVMRDALTKAIRVLVKPGVVIDMNKVRGLPDHLWSVRTASGNDRGTRLFRIESEPTVEPNVIHPNLSRWRCRATPISEKTGKDMLASAGNKGRRMETVELCGYFGAADRNTKESSNDLALCTVRAAAESLSAQEKPE